MYDMNQQKYAFMLLFHQAAAPAAFATTTVVFVSRFAKSTVAPYERPLPGNVYQYVFIFTM